MWGSHYGIKNPLEIKFLRDLKYYKKSGLIIILKTMQK